MLVMGFFLLPLTPPTPPPPSPHSPLLFLFSSLLLLLPLLLILSHSHSAACVSCCSTQFQEEEMGPFRIKLLPRVFLTWKSVWLSWNPLFIENPFPLPTCPSLPLPWEPAFLNSITQALSASALWVQPMGDISKRKKRKRRGMYPPAPLLSMVWPWPYSSAVVCSSCPVTLSHSRSSPQDL